MQISIYVKFDVVMTREGTAQAIAAAGAEAARQLARPHFVMNVDDETPLYSYTTHSASMHRPD